MDIFKNFILDNYYYIGQGIDLFKEYWWIYLLLGFVSLIVLTIVINIWLMSLNIGF